MAPTTRPGVYRREPMPNPPALVVGGQLNGLGVCRSLAQAGIETYVLDTRWYDPASWSRFATPIRVSSLWGRELVTALRTIDLPEGTVLIITDEMAVYTISEYREELIAKFRVRLPSHEMVLIQSDKALFHNFATASGLPVPNSVIIGADAGVFSIRDLRFPVVIKPAAKRDFHLKGVARLVIAGDQRQAEIACRNLLSKTPELIVQECIEGPDDAIYFCLFYRKDNIVKDMFIGRKLASIPRGIGSTGLCVRVEANDLREKLAHLTETFLAVSNYEGIGGIEYKWDARSKRFLIIEPTVGRTDWQEEISALSGINIPALAYFEECNLPVTSSRRIPNVVWQQSYIDRIRSGFGIVPPNSTVLDGYWRRDDPLPALLYYPFAFMMLTRGLMYRIARRPR